MTTAYKELNYSEEYELKENLKVLISRYGVDAIVRAAAEYMTENAKRIAGGISDDGFVKHGQRTRGEILSIVANMFKHVDRGYNGK